MGGVVILVIILVGIAIYIVKQYMETKHINSLRLNNPSLRRFSQLVDIMLTRDDMSDSFYKLTRFINSLNGIPEDQLDRNVIENYFDKHGQKIDDLIAMNRKIIETRSYTYRKYLGNIHGISNNLYDEVLKERKRREIEFKNNSKNINDEYNDKLNNM